MSSFEDRKKNFENKFAHDEELKFKVNSKRNKYLGEWAAEILEKKDQEKEQYILELKFSKSDKLKNIYFYDKSLSTDVAMSSLETKTEGTKESFFQQILGNFGVPGMKRGGPILGSGKADD